jgi:hypothetical protein
VGRGGIYTFGGNLIPMESISPELKKEVFWRKDQLERAKIQLKGEFVETTIELCRTKAEEFVYKLTVLAIR